MADEPSPASDRRGHGEEAFGGKPVGRRVALPRGAEEPIKVYINGVEQVRGEDFVVRSREIVFREPIVKEQLRSLNPLRKLGLGLGLFGWYERNEVVDIEYRYRGSNQLLSDAPVIPGDSG
jgi:hypothetical protein